MYENEHFWKSIDFLGCVCYNRMERVYANVPIMHGIIESGAFEV